MEIPEDLTALSNMPEKETKKGNKQGTKVVSFERTPVMSTYLLAWGFGDFEYIEDFTRRKYNGKNLPVRVYTTRGLKEQGKLALESAHQVVDYFSEVSTLFLQSRRGRAWSVAQHLRIDLRVLDALAAVTVASTASTKIEKRLLYSSRRTVAFSSHRPIQTHCEALMPQRYDSRPALTRSIAHATVTTDES